MDYAKMGERLKARADGPANEPDRDEGKSEGDGLADAFTPSQAAAIRAYVKACMDEG